MGFDVYQMAAAYLTAWVLGGIAFGIKQALDEAHWFGKSAYVIMPITCGLVSLVLGAVSMVFVALAMIAIGII